MWWDSGMLYLMCEAWANLWSRSSSLGELFTPKQIHGRHTLKSMVPVVPCLPIPFLTINVVTYNLLCIYVYVCMYVCRYSDDRPEPRLRRSAGGCHRQVLRRQVDGSQLHIHNVPEYFGHLFSRSQMLILFRITYLNG